MLGLLRLERTEEKVSTRECGDRGEGGLHRLRLDAQN